MRLRSLLVPLLAALAATSCRTTENPQPNDEARVPAEMASEPAPENPAASEAQPSAQPAEAAVVDATVGLEDRTASQDAGSAQQDPGSVQDDAARIKVQRERVEALSKQYIAVGDRLRDQADLPGALREYSKALEVDPTSHEARERINGIQSLMGERFSTAAEFFDDAVARETVRRAQALIAAENASTQGDAAFRAGDYDVAVARYREAQTILAYHPLIATQSLDEKIIGGKLQAALDRQAEANANLAARTQAEAEAARLQKEQEAATYRETRLRTLYQQANTAFLADNYAEAESLANLILLQDPGNQAAIAMRDTAQVARHKSTDEATRKRYREQWQRTFDELDTMDVPQTSSLVFDDLRRWREVSQRSALEFTGSTTAADPDTAAVMQRLETTRFAPKFRGPNGGGSPLEEIAQFLQNLTGVNFMISAKVKEDLDDEQKTIDLDLNERSVRKVLDIIADTHENLRWKVEDGVVKFVTKDEMHGMQILKTYEVRDIIHPVPSFAGREINISPSGGLEQPQEDAETREGLVVTSAALESLIRDNISPQSWNDDPSNSVRITEAGTLVVFQTAEVHDQIQHLLDDLREATGIMVDIQARFLKVEDNFLEDIGVDFRGLGQPGLGTNTFINDFGDASTQADLGKEIGQGTDLGAFYDDGQDGDVRARVEQLYDVALGNDNVLNNAGGLAFQWTYLNDLQMELVLRAVAKNERRELVTAPRLLVFNTARANISVMNQVAYVQDFDVEIAQAASIADPIIKVVEDGVVLDVHPVVSADRRFVMMELRPTVATLKRPIKEVATTLGSQNSVTIQLPELDIQRVKTTVPMPDGGTVMLGGLRVSEKQDLRSGIPILNQIPVLRFLFERKGTYAANQKLLILITANIVIPQEHEPTPAQLGF
jgi:type II secretory pathway component GspD/PulD (secretin)